LMLFWIYSIIKDRVQFAFKLGAIKDDLLKIVSGLAGGGARIAFLFQLLSLIVMRIDLYGLISA